MRAAPPDLESLSAQEVLAHVVDEYHPRLYVACSFQKEASVILDMLLAIEPAARPRSASDVAARLRTWLAQKHPEGVTRALGKRVEQARARMERVDRGQSERPPPITSSDPHNTSQLTRSIATSQSLDALLASATEALPRAAARASAEPASPAPPVASAAPIAPAPRPRRIGASLVALAIALLAGGLFALAPRSPAPIEPAEVAAGLPEPPAPAAAPTVPAPAAPSPAAVPQPPQPPQPESAPAKVEASPVARAARLTVNALPWAELRLDGRPLGVTPQRGLSVPAGTHLLELDCPPLGRSARIPIKLAPGAHDQVLVDLNADPPRRVQ